MASSADWVTVNDNEASKTHSNERVESNSSAEDDQNDIFDDAANQTTDSSMINGNEITKFHSDERVELKTLAEDDQNNVVVDAGNQTIDVFKEIKDGNDEDEDEDEDYHDTQPPIPDNDTEHNNNENTNMSSIRNEINSSTDHVNLPLSSTMRTNFKMHLFMLRYAKTDEKLQVEGRFSRDIKLAFKTRALLKPTENKIPYMFSLELNLTHDSSGKLSVLHNNKWHDVTNYKLKLFDFADNEKHRVLCDPHHHSHELLFNVHFKKGVIQSPPGSDVPFWSQLCLFTCFFLQQSNCEVFNELINQFKAAAKPGSCSTDQCKDFFNECDNYIVSCLEKSINKSNGIKQIIRMIELLPINTQNFQLPNSPTENFTAVILNELTKNLKPVIGSLTDNEWNSFNGGITTLIGIQLLSQKDKQSKTNPLELLLDASIQTARLEIIKRVLDVFKNIGLDKDIPELMWLQLLALDSCDKLIDSIPLKEISFEAYLMCATKVVPALLQSDNFINRLSTHFDDAVEHDQFFVNLDGITVLLNFLQKKSSDETNLSVKTIRSVIDSSVPLRDKIKQYMWTSNFTIYDFNSIRDIFILSIESNILFNVKRKEFLCKLLTNNTYFHPVEFYTKWFLAFMSRNEKETSLLDDDEFKELLKTWTTCFEQRPDPMIEIIKQIDMLISAIGDQSCSEHFIKHMVDLCYQQKSIIEKIENSVLLVQNPKFLSEFKLKYKTNVLSACQNTLKELNNTENPLYILISIDDKTNYQNRFLHELIEMACENIKINDAEILQDVFYQPTDRAFTYFVLFLRSFETTHIRQYIVDRLLAQSISWEEIGMRWDEISAWERYTNEQRAVADKVWAYICEVSSKKFELVELIKTENDKLQEKLEIIKMLPSCLDFYCSNATDKQHYKDLVQNIADSFADKIIRTVVIPDDIEKLVPIAKRLDRYAKSNVWHLFRQQPMTSLAPTTDANEKETTDPSTCHDLLTEADRKFDLFTARVNDICTNWKTLPVSNWIHLFPDIHFIDYDLDILKPLLNAEVAPILKQILDFWKDRESHIFICQGIVSLLTYLEVPIDGESCLLFDSIEQLDETKTGDDFYKIRENFSKYYLNKYSSKVFDIISRYKTSDELITFLHKLAALDMDNLLEAVNDWDETLISTKTVLDLIRIKNFLDRVYANINLIPKEQPVQDEIHRIILCFEEVQKDEEFKSIIQCFNSCSKLLTSIKRVYMDLTNKEQSKRRRIFDIVQSVCFGFVQLPVNIHGRIDHRFDVFIEQQAMHYADLSELCDRARLIEYSSNSTNKMRKDSEQEIRELRLFVGMVAVIETVLTNLTSLNMSGHPYVLDYLSPKTEFTCIAGNYQKLSEFSSSLETLLIDWEKNLCAMYQQNIDLTYFANQQIWMVEDYLYSQASASDDHPGYHLLNFIGIEPRQIETNFLIKRSEQLHERLKNIARILSIQREKYIPEVQVKHLSLNKILVVQTSYEGILRGILSLFNLTKVQAQVHQIFYCSDTTSWTEMRAFAYRCFYSQETLHQLIRPELLTALVQDQFTRFLYKLVKKEPKRLFHLGIVTTALTAHLQLINGLKALKIVSIIQDHDLLDKIVLHEMVKELVKDNSTLVTSHIAGLGKSSYISDEIQRTGKLCVKFSINGNINVDTLAERLRIIGKKMTLANVALHIDIGVVDNIQQLNELLYCLLLFRSFRLGQEAAYIPSNIPIYIEIDSSPQSLTAHAKMVVLQFLPCHHIETMDLDQLKVANMASLQLVANYLQAIDDGTIIKQNIGKGNMTQIDAKKCIALLQKHFLKEKNKDYITWTQLSIFASVYENLFDGFSQCGHFIVEMMQEVQNNQLRINILQTLLQSSNQFTSLSVESVRKNQRSTDEDRAIFSDAIVRWDKSQPFTVVFSDSHDPIFVYKTVDKVSQSLKKEFDTFNEVLKRNGLPEQNLLPDYSKLTHAEFFIKLTSLSKKYYSKSICPNCFTQFENNIPNCTNCPTKDVLCHPHQAKSGDVDKIIERMGEKIKSEYVLTPDNYIKMLLIYLRVQSNIPVLIMGETGKIF